MSNITKLTPKREPVAMDYLDEIRSYMTAPSRPYEPGEIDPVALRDEFEDYPASVPPAVYDALLIHVEHGDNNPLKHMPTTTPHYLEIKAYLKQFEVGEW